jgi:hypothetical protein
MSIQKHSLIILTAIVSMILLVNPVMAGWSIQSTDYSVAVDFYADNTGTIHLSYPVLWDLKFDYIKLQDHQYRAYASLLGVHYHVDFTHSNNTITSKAYPDTRLIWVP